MNLLAMTSHMSQDVPRGLEWARRALRKARLAGDRAREATALSYLGLITGVDGRYGGERPGDVWTPRSACQIF